MGTFAVVDNGEIVNMDHVIKITDVPTPASRDPYIELVMDNGDRVTASGTQMEGIKKYIFRNAIAV